MKNLTQTDSRWANIPLGNCTRATIGSDGCFITSLAMLLYTTPDVINKKLIEGGGYINGCLLDSKKASAILGIPYNGRKNADFEPVAPCIAEVDYNPATAHKDQHFVVCLGFKGADGHWVIKDPLYSTNQSLKRYGGRVVSWRMFEEVKPFVPDVHEEVEALENALKVADEHLENIKSIINSK